MEISKEQNEKQAIEEMAKVLERVCDKIVCSDYHMNCELCQATRLYDAGYRKQSEWISVEERLPDNHRTVLVACKGITVGGAAPISVGSYGGGHWFLADAEGTLYLTKYMHIVVTHWMPLPEPPKMKGGAE